MRKTLQVMGRQLTYATRRLLPGDIFVASARDARLLTRMGRVRELRDEVDLPPPPAALLAKFDNDGKSEITRLREEYLKKFGKRAFNGWPAAVLAEKISNG